VRGLVVVAKYPRAGQVKTRLAAAIGAEPACALYRAFLADLDERLCTAGYAPLWAYTPADAPFAGSIAAAPRCFAQVGPDLNARLRNIFQALLGAGWQRVAIISSDTPHLPLGWLDEAYRALDDHDLVLGPADDGGYSLIAMAAPHDVFDGVAMGTNRVLGQTLALARAQDLRSHLLASTFDVDEPADLARLAAALREPALRRSLPCTTRALLALGILAPAEAGVRQPAGAERGGE
jgi:rSAM/selenodomain-associated transferase 1